MSNHKTVNPGDYVKVSGVPGIVTRVADTPERQLCNVVSNRGQAYLCDDSGTLGESNKKEFIDTASPMTLIRLGLSNNP
jgi:hypothetical protein